MFNVQGLWQVPMCVLFFLFFFGFGFGFGFVLFWCVFSTPQSLIIAWQITQKPFGLMLKDAFLRGNKNFPKQIFQYPGVRTEKRE
jgi:hypothetical protein